MKSSIPPLPVQRGSLLPRWQAAKGMALLFTLFHLMLVLRLGGSQFDLEFLTAVVGLGASLLGWWLSSQERHWSKVRFIFLGILACWLLTDTQDAVKLHQGLSIWMVLDTVLLTLLLFTTLPLRPAILSAALTYVFFIFTSSLAGQPNPVLLGVVGITSIMTAYLSLHGQQIFQTQLHNEMLRWQLQHDGLTGAMTRQALLEQMLPRLGGPHLLLLVDLDHFKMVNDHYGHLAGDEALRQVTHIMQQQVRAGDLVCRWGGEEFAVFLPGVTLEQGRQIAERISSGVRHIQQANMPSLTVSIGIASLLGASSLNAVVAQADARLYTAKARGRNQVVDSDLAPRQAHHHVPAAEARP